MPKALVIPLRSETVTFHQQVDLTTHAGIQVAPLQADDLIHRHEKNNPRRLHNSETQACA